MEGRAVATPCTMHSCLWRRERAVAAAGDRPGCAGRLLQILCCHFAWGFPSCVLREISSWPVRSSECCTMMPTARNLRPAVIEVPGRCWRRCCCRQEERACAGPPCDATVNDWHFDPETCLSQSPERDGSSRGKHCMEMWNPKAFRSSTA